MRICIVTVYNSINCGSFWQARALQLFLKKKGHDVFFLHRNSRMGSSFSLTSKIITLLKSFLQGGVISFFLQLKSFRNFRTYCNLFNIIPPKIVTNSNIDLVILGSDTIWNLNESYFVNERLRYWGGIFEKIPIISYAASCSNTLFETICKYPELKDCISKLKYISVRDMHTLKMISKLEGRKINLVCDPTFLLEREDYLKMIKDVPKQGFIFLYLFSELSIKQKNEIREFAIKNRLSIISGTRYQRFCDKNVVNEPYCFLRYMSYASYVITDTFHGTIFSVILKRQFVVIESKKKKINDFLSITDLSSRIVLKNTTIVHILADRVDYENADLIQRIAHFKIGSIQFLNNVLCTLCITKA